MNDVRDENKFNFHSKSREWFPIKQLRFNTDNHPIIKSRKVLRYRMDTLVSQQQELMLVGLTNTLQCSQREAIRIAFYEASRRGSDRVKFAIPYASRYTELQGHTSRTRKIKVALTKEEKANILDLGKQLELSGKEVFRLAFLWMQLELRAGTLKNIHKCRLISQDDLAREWSRSNEGKSRNPNTQQLKKYIELGELLLESEINILDCLPMNTQLVNLMGYPFVEDEVINYGCEEALKKNINLIQRHRNKRERQIFGLMFTYEVSKDIATTMYEDDLKEYDDYMYLSQEDLLKLKRKVHEEMKKDESNKEDSIRAITPTLSKEEKLEKDKLRMKDLIYEFYQLDKKNNN